MSAVDRLHFGPMELPVHESWGSLEQAVARWVIGHGGSRELAAVAAWATFADRRGDSALVLKNPGAGHLGMEELTAHQLKALRQESLVADMDNGAAPRPPFLIDHDHFYLWRNFSHERELAKAFSVRCAADSAVVAAEPQDMAVLFGGVQSGRDAAQRQAVQGVAGKRLFVLTGGPGTGKTTTALRMLLMLARNHMSRGNPAPLIRLTAPTGKAAQRLAEAIAAGLERVGGAQEGDGPVDGRWPLYKEAVAGAQAGTLHRLLGSGPHGFRHHAGNPVAADIVVVDEASMADLALQHFLLDALRPHAVLILLGDADQLTSVDTGSVLLDLVGALEKRKPQNLVRLAESFRSVPALTTINAAILQGDVQHFHQAWRQAERGQAARRRQVVNADDLEQALQEWTGPLLSWLKKCRDLRCDEQHACAYLDKLRQYQLLCAMRRGPFGAVAANATIERSVKRHLKIAQSVVLYPGRAVMVRRNDAGRTGLFNGDVGLCLYDEQGVLGVWFERALQAPSGQKSVCFAPGNLPAHQGAFAITIHKSQGSEYDHVAVLLPPEAENPILSRQLLYTGISRARREVALWASDEAICQAITTPVARKGRLEARLLDELEKA